jgi:hypothetical protein
MTLPEDWYSARSDPVHTGPDTPSYKVAWIKL